MKYFLIAVVLLSSCGEGLINGSGDASSCTVEQTVTGAVIKCLDGSVATVSNGSDGINGADGADGLDGTVITFVDPCPTISHAFPELLALIEGTYYAVYASGAKVHLAKLTPGTYQTTDGRSCVFTINAEGQLQF